jgi:uncharacterized membrane protein
MSFDFPFYIYAWIASILYALVALLSKIVSKHAITNPWLFNFVWSMTTAAITGIVAVYFGVGLPMAWLSVVWVGIGATVAGILYFLALYKLDITVIGPLYNARTVFSFLLASIF